MRERISEYRQKFFFDIKNANRFAKFPNFISFDLKNNFMEVFIMDK